MMKVWRQNRQEQFMLPETQEVQEVRESWVGWDAFWYFGCSSDSQVRGMFIWFYAQRCSDMLSEEWQMERHYNASVVE